MRTLTTPSFAPRFAAFPPAACLLHADYHPMTSECWGATVDWYFTHDHLDQAAARDAYLAAVEREMLDRHARREARHRA
ncbi:hypothetical protein [Streptomyces sp. NPDC047981]|uniref:hypothetical protein n=1 Tax=Streptomyces sp. NPDC047981 TaxID=3154610 RepID=UPI00341E4A18